MHFDKFTKVVMLMTSDQDGEALSALRMATAELNRRGVTWEDVLQGFMRDRRRLRDMQGYRPEENRWSKSYGGS